MQDADAVVLRRPKPTAPDDPTASSSSVRATFSGGSRPKSIFPTAVAEAEAPLRPRNNNGASTSAPGAAGGRARPTTVYEAGGAALAPVVTSAATATADPAFKRTATQSKLPKELREKEKEVRRIKYGSRRRVGCLECSRYAMVVGGRGTAAQNKAAAAAVKEAEKNPLSAEAKAVLAQFAAKTFTDEYADLFQNAPLAAPSYPPLPNPTFSHGDETRTMSNS